ncbi:MAG: hypothetical protein STSR0003_03840 [Smithella sp.]
MELSHDSDLLAIIKMLATFGRHSNVVCAYTELFGLRPLKTKTKKWRVLLEEMKRLFDSESFTYQKRAYKISQAGIVEALNVVVHRNFTDWLDSHNYLKKIMIGIAEKEERESGKQAERDLRKKEGSLMSGARYPETEEVVQLPKMKEVPPARLTEEQVEENRRRLKDMIKQIGG